MFQRMIDDFKECTGTAVRLTSLAAAAAFALLVTTSFLCAALFVSVLQKYGLIEACLAGAGVFFVVTLIAAVCYMVRKRQIAARAEQAAREAARSAKSAAQNMLADPMLLAAGLQVVRAIGIKKLIPILAIGGLALGFMASRNAARATKRRRSNLIALRESRKRGTKRSGHAAAGLQQFCHFAEHADRRLAGHGHLAIAGLLHGGSRRAAAGLLGDGHANQHRGVGKAV